MADMMTDDTMFDDVLFEGLSFDDETVGDTLFDDAFFEDLFGGAMLDDTASDDEVVDSEMTDVEKVGSERAGSGAADDEMVAEERSGGGMAGSGTADGEMVDGQEIGGETPDDETAEVRLERDLRALLSTAHVHSHSTLVSLALSEAQIEGLIAMIMCDFGRMPEDFSVRDSITCFAVIVALYRRQSASEMEGDFGDPDASEYVGRMVMSLLLWGVRDEPDDLANALSNLEVVFGS